MEVVKRGEICRSKMLVSQKRKRESQDPSHAPPAQNAFIPLSVIFTGEKQHSDSKGNYYHKQEQVFMKRGTLNILSELSSYGKLLSWLIARQGIYSQV